MSNDNPQSGAGRPLPKKEADLFKNVIKFYESKQYKKGLKNADTILKRFPNHGETLCMKGLILNSMASSEYGNRGLDCKEEEKEKVEEAKELVKKGLMFDMRSHVCWHVYGLLYRSHRNYPEAIKAYKQAIRIDPNNLQILRDMSVLQIQMRDLSGFRETRLKILTLRPNNKVHWLSYALAVHVCGDPEGALGVLDNYMNTLGESSEEFKRGFESSELALYKNKVLSETTSSQDGGNYFDELLGVKKALKHLDEIADVIVDQTGWLQAKLSYQLQLGMFDDAIETCHLLFWRGSTEDHRVHSAYMCALLHLDRKTWLEVEKLRGTTTLATFRPLLDEEREVLLKAYGITPSTTNGSSSQHCSADGAMTKECLALAFPKSAAIKRIYLTLLPPSSAEFRLAIDKYCQRQIVKGVPSLGSDLSSLYLMEGKNQESEGRLILARDPVDVKFHPVYCMLVELVESYISSLTTQSTFPNDSIQRPPSVLLWAWYLRSILHEQSAEYAKGITLINKCIDHTPTGVDFYELKARLLEAGGDIQRAADVIDSGRDLDHQDRYINNQTTKTLLRAGREDEARKRISMFTRHEGNPEQNLYDMQCAWYELELADSLARKGKLGMSLRKYTAVIKHYEDFHEDQFDFHAYCVRKVTLRSYCDLLKFEDEIWGQPFYCRAAERIIQIYLGLFDAPTKSQSNEEPDYSKMTPAERKKAKNIARKKKKALEKKSQDSASGVIKDTSKSVEDNGSKKKKPHAVDIDPEGKELLALNPLEEAQKFASILIKHAPKRITSWALHYDVSVRRGKMLMGLQALHRMIAIDSNHHDLFARIVDFSQKLDSRTTTCHAASEGVILSEFPKLLDGKVLSDFIKSTLDSVQADPLSSLPMRIVLAKALISSNIATQSECVSLILDSKLSGRFVTMTTCRDALEFMESMGKDAIFGKRELMTLIISKFPFAKDF
mmetsp:Transcript_2204/g.4222  ORF Transcript_2204/g.4222 Transcript_2204/m.4222 type:complete len:950 (-) Transcript_2204:232-3081(-)|eukprot:CAMPEP_0171344090 /NCGR_PEP_ID=MMETSP0878-20121228/18619_1 /TAXON_ID=67004 /ORGANISM="Thalassiosira weissflogii, Strain CCMP1336" /LENGTH=949 /DNA_ID=CAMNT_0011847199 /DNA_START=234 /DNA_END=3083 /DNA_ORIENTATION=+